MGVRMSEAQARQARQDVQLRNELMAWHLAMCGAFDGLDVGLRGHLTTTTARAALFAGGV